MFDTLSAAIDEVGTDLRGPELAELLSLLDRLQAKASAAVAAFDRASLWDLDAATSMTAWLRDRGQMSGGGAARMVSTAKRLAALPVTAAAWQEGRLSSGQVEAIVANTNNAT